MPPLAVGSGATLTVTAEDRVEHAIKALGWMMPGRSACSTTTRSTRPSGGSSLPATTEQADARVRGVAGDARGAVGWVHER